MHKCRGTKLIVTYHPAFLLRDPRQKKEAWQDLKLAMAELGLSVPSLLMSTFCDVVLPVPLDRAFTYKLKAEDDPPVGGRVVVPFRQEKLIGVVTRLHDEAPPVEARLIESVLTRCRFSTPS